MYRRDKTSDVFYWTFCWWTWKLMFTQINLKRKMYEYLSVFFAVRFSRESKSLRYNKIKLNNCFFLRCNCKKNVLGKCHLDPVLRLRMASLHIRNIYSSVNLPSKFPLLKSYWIFLYFMNDLNYFQSKKWLCNSKFYFPNTKLWWKITY